MRCKHENLGHVETIEAYHQTMYDDGKPLFNNEYGNSIRKQVDCFDCGKTWIVRKSSPKFVREFDKKVERDRKTKM